MHRPNAEGVTTLLLAIFLIMITGSCLIAASPADKGKSKRATSEVRKHNGVPTVFIDGKPSDGMMAALYSDGPRLTRLFSAAGVNMYTFLTSASAAYWSNPSTVAVVAPGKYNYSDFDRQVNEILSANPNAYIMPRLDFCAPDWWMEQHPDDLVQCDRGDGKYQVMVTPDRGLIPDEAYEKAGLKDFHKTVPSWASEEYRLMNVDALKRLIEHIDSSPYADRIASYFISSGISNEWFMWESELRHATDFSPANTRKFRTWLKARYVTDAALRKAWGMPLITLDTAAVPPKSVRDKTEFGVLRDPSKEQWILDYLTYNSWLVGDTIEYFASSLKKFTGGKQAVGTFYGYVLGLCGEPRQQYAGHTDLDWMMNTKSVDFYGSPGLYWEFRNLGTGAPGIMSCLGSLILHGKPYYVETDFATSATEGTHYHGMTKTVPQDVLQQRRNLCWLLTNGINHWWANVLWINYDNQTVRDEMRRFVKLAPKAQSYDRSPVDEVAFVVDPKSVLYHAIGDELGSNLIRDQLLALQRFGGSAAHYTLADLPEIRDRKVFIFANILAPTQEERKLIDSLKRDGHVLVFVYASGVFRDGKIDVEGMQELTGIRLTRSETATSLVTQITTDDRSFAKLNGTKYGPARAIDPAFLPSDPTAKSIGFLADGRPSLAVKNHGNWTSVFSASPLLPASLIRALAERAGVHLYMDTEDGLWVTKDILTVSVDKGGLKEIKLPRKRKVYDPFSGKLLATSDRFTVRFAPLDTRMFFLKDPLKGDAK